MMITDVLGPDLLAKWKWEGGRGGYYHDHVCIDNFHISVDGTHTDLGDIHVSVEDTHVCDDVCLCVLLCVANAPELSCV